jgi:hypothetical protein
MSAPGPRKPRLEGAQNALGEFLRARRRLVTPEEVGIPATGRGRASAAGRVERRRVDRHTHHTVCAILNAFAIPAPSSVVSH